MNMNCKEYLWKEMIEDMRKKSENTNSLENKIDNKEEVKLEDNKIEENKIKDNKKESKTVKATEQKENNQEKTIEKKISSKKTNSEKANEETEKEKTSSKKISKEKNTNSEKSIKEKKIMQSTIAEISTEAKENLSEVESKSLLKKEGSEIDAEKLKTIRDEIKTSKKVSKDKVKNSALRKKLQRNLLIAILVTIYFLFIDLGINSIPITVYIQDLKTFTIFIVLIAIVIFEKAYKKDENYLALHGIEMVVIGIETLLILQLYSTGNEYFKYVLLGITLGMLAYYIIKCLIIYIRYKVTRK